MNPEVRHHIGQTAVSLVATFPTKFPNVSHFYFKSYRPVPGVEARLKVNELSITDLRALYNDPQALINEMLKHVNDDETQDSIEVDAQELTSRLPQLATECRQRREVLALYSVCREKNGNILHIPMMDFRVKSGSDDGQLNLLHCAISGIRQHHGAFLESGNSYHYYGFNLLSRGEWRWFMAACVLLAPLVDIRYISHRLLAGKAALRLTTGPGKEVEPSLAKWW